VSRAHLRTGQWEQAAAAHAQAAALLGPDDHGIWRQKVCFRLRAGDQAGYRQACARFLERYEASTDASVADEIADFCVQMPRAVADPKRIVPVAERALASNLKDPYRLHLLGLAHYRAGQYPQALLRLKEALALSPEEGSPRPLIWLGLALTQQRLGQPVEARQWLDRAVAWHREVRSGPRKDDPLLWPLMWWVTTSFEVLRREAETALAP
jgi:Flp pilus assembly protein TadD